MQTDALPAGEIHLYYANLLRPDDEVHALAELLDDAERERARRFKFDVHRRRLVVRRGLLRRLLARYTGLEAAAIRYDDGKRGKPALAGEIPFNLHFNLSDSDELAAVALTRDVELGVDVEMLREMPDALSISKHYFSEREREVLNVLPPGEVDTAFFNCWTRKEAYLKAIGEGLAEPLDSFAVTLRPDEPARFLEFVKVPHEVGAWSLHHLRPTHDSVGALAIRRHGDRIVERGWL